MSYIPLSVALPEAFWPGSLLEAEDGEFFDKFSIEAYEERASDYGFEVYVRAGVQIGASLHLPFLEGVSLDFGEFAGTDAGMVEVLVLVELAEDAPPIVTVTLTANTLALGFAPSILQPVTLVPEGDLLTIVKQPGKVSIPLPFEVKLTYDGNDWDLSFEMGTATLNLPQCMVGETGVVIEATGLSFNVSGTGANKPATAAAGWKGLYFDSVKLWVPDLFNGHVDATGLGIGTGGLYGRIAGIFPVSYVATATPKYTGTFAGKILGFEGAISAVTLEFVQNALVEFEIKAQIFLPFLDRELALKVDTDFKGALSIAVDSADDLAVVSVQNMFDLALSSLAFEHEDRKAAIKLGGKLTPTFGDFKWPSFDIKELKIDSKGHVDFAGGWIDLPKQYGFDFNGFKVEITKFGFGRNDDGTKWIGMSGGVELVKGLPAGASVEGLRITAEDDWSNPRISFEGVGVELEIPNVLQFKGAVDYREFPDPSLPNVTVRRFDGDITLKLKSIDLEIDGTLVAGSAGGYNYLALYVDVELPTGIPLGASGIGLYGFAGLLALQMKPDKTDIEPWYGLSNDGWYDKSPVGIENIRSKWINAKGSRAFGAGVSFGTFADNGHMFNGRLLLAIILPGGVVMLQGKANILKDRADLSQDAMFRTIAIFDKPGGEITFGVDADYQYDKASGKLIKIGGGLEAYYNYKKQGDWHLHLGLREPREKRIQARIFDLFDANAYFMLDPHQLAMGAWAGYSRGWQFSKLSVKLEAWMEGNAIVSFKPPHLHGDMWVHGAVELKVFKFGLGLSVDARIEADVFTPKHLLGQFRVSIDLPKPLKDLSADVSLEWGPDAAVPPLPIVLKDVAIEHLKSSAVWPLPAGKLLHPDYNDQGFLIISGIGSSDGDLSVAQAHGQVAADEFPIVPMDCRPSIAFARNVWDDALVGTLPQSLDPPWERIGDPQADQGPANVRYGLGAVHLEKYDAGWTTVASADGAVVPNDSFFGTWQLTTGVGGTQPAQNKLLLWSKSGFDQYRNTSADVTSGALDYSTRYPCPPPPTATHKCLDFIGLDTWKTYSAPLAHPDGGVWIGLAEETQAWGEGEHRQINFFPIPGKLYIQKMWPYQSPLPRVLQPDLAKAIWIAFSPWASNITITALALWTAEPLVAYAMDYAGLRTGPYSFVNDEVTIHLPDVAVVFLSCPGATISLVKICATFPPSQDLVDSHAAMSQHNASANSHGYDAGQVLEPFTQYRLRIDTSVRAMAADGSYDDTHVQVQYAYFQTGGPPGVGKLSVPIGGDKTNFDSGLDDLGRYVRQTVPPTVPAAGQPPLSPRPVYCGYDVRVDFTENYVSLMYRMAGRDLALLLYDRNNQPVRDSAGALVVAENPWDVQPDVTQSQNDSAWTQLTSASTCVNAFDSTQLPHDERLTQVSELAPDMRHEARLVPTLLHEDFGGFALAQTAAGPAGQLGRWQIVDAPAAATNGTISNWTIETANNSSAQRVVQKNAVAPAQTGQLAPPGTMLVLGDFAGLPGSDPTQPGAWSDVRLSLRMRAGASADVGVAFRYAGLGAYYLLVMENGSVLRLVRVDSAGASLLGLAPFPFNQQQDYHVVIEAIGANFRVSVDDRLALAVADTAAAPHLMGRIALFCTGGKDSAFSEIQVHDFGGAARPAYRFSFTTSAYLDFFHHLHGFEDGCWRAAGTGGTPMAQAAFASFAQQAVATLSGPTTEAEALAFEAVALDTLGQPALQAAARVEISKVERTASSSAVAAALLVRGPQPFGFARNLVTLLNTTTVTPTAISPLSLKLVDAVLDSATPDDEYITILALEGCDPSGHVVEKRDYSASPTGTAIPVEPLDDPASNWTPIFTFAAGSGVQSAGHRMRIHSGAPFTPASAEQRTALYFAAPTGQSGTLQLDDEAVDLRIRAPDGTIVHARRFLKAAYAPVPIRVLRKRDETAFLILPASGQSFAAGSYRLDMTYLRRNPADPDSPILTQSGDSTPERAVLDFAWQPFA